MLDWGSDLEPLTAAPRLTPAPPQLRAEALRAQRILIAGAVLMVTAAGLGLAAFVSAGFVRTELALAAAIACAVGGPLCLNGSRRSNAAVRAAGYGRIPGVLAVVQPDYLLEPDASPAVGLAALVLLPAMFIVAVALLPSVVAAGTLFHPAVGIAVSDGPPTGCPACHSGTTFRTASGVTIYARLAGVMGPSSDGDGTTVVYDADSPTHAVSGSDYARGHSLRRLGQLLFAVGLAAATLAWTMAVTRSRRRMLGDGRAHVPIGRLRLVRRARGRDTWLATYQDGITVRFQDTVPQRRALIRRIEEDPGGFRPDAEIWRTLTTGGR